MRGSSGWRVSAFLLTFSTRRKKLRSLRVEMPIDPLTKSTMRWRWSALILYLVICFYDFMFVPIWYGLNRPDISQFIDILNTVEDPLIQLELMKKLTGQHQPFTLMGGGLFHLAFGAILTGSAINAINKK